MKQTHAARAEALAAKKEEQRRMEKERILQVIPLRDSDSFLCRLAPAIVVDGSAFNTITTLSIRYLA